MYVFLCVLLVVTVGAKARVAVEPDAIDSAASLKAQKGNLTDYISITTNEIEDDEDNTKNNNISDKNAGTDTSLNSEKTESERPVDNGTALILTPFIEKGATEEARNLSRVDPSLFLEFKSYSGFLTVNKTYNSNIYFWYFPATDGKPANETPWLLWLQGGPGASSLIGVFDEFGPFKYVDGKLVRNEHTWLQDQALVFMDNPVGTGYSFTEHEDGYATDMPTYTEHLYTAFAQLVQLFPELRAAPLFVAGESYAGKFVPALASAIHDHIDDPDARVNLQGIIVGNGYVDPGIFRNLLEPYRYFGLLDHEQIEAVRPLQDAYMKAIENNNSLEAKERWISLVSVLLAVTGQQHGYQVLRDELGMGNFYTFLKRSETKRALHVGDIETSYVNLTVNSRLAPEFLTSARPLYERLLPHYRVLMYCGHLDLIIPCPLSSESYRDWQWDNRQDFINAGRFPLRIDNKLAGYFKTGGNMTEVMIRGAGHMVPIDAGAVARTLVSRWVRRRMLGPPAPFAERAIIEKIVNNMLALKNVTEYQLYM